jgi:SAM-dependent methyltransferase
MVEFVVDFGKTGLPAQTDGRLDAPAFGRNHEPIWSAISGYLSTQAGDILETGSGTGQHAAAFAARAGQLTWWPSDIYDSHLQSIAAWQAHARLENLRPPQRIDLADPLWTWTGDAGNGGPLTAILCINVLHISPWRVAQNLFAGAGRYLRDGGQLFIYGPFKRDGAPTAPSNERFDATLRAENPEWGVRHLSDLNALALGNGLTQAEVSPMPANNLVLAFAQPLRQNSTSDRGTKRQ